MTTQQFLTSAWVWNVPGLVLSGGALIGYVLAFGLNRRIPYLLAGIALFVLTLVSPLNALAAGYLFSAHMLQHILLLLVVPALLLMSLPRWVSLGPRSAVLANPVVGWLGGVGAMWLWHARPLCNAGSVIAPRCRVANRFASRVRRDFLATNFCAAGRGATVAACGSALSFQRLRRLQHSWNSHHFFAGQRLSDLRPITR